MTKTSNPDEIHILLPDREVTIAGEAVTVREYSLNDSMQLYHDMDGFIVSLADALGNNDTIQINEIESLIARHYESVVKLVARSIDKPVDYVKSLSAQDGLLLLDTWWIVNSPFFINAAARKLFQRAAQERQERKSVGGEYSPPSSGPGTRQTV